MVGVGEGLDVVALQGLGVVVLARPRVAAQGQDAEWGLALALVWGLVQEKGLDGGLQLVGLGGSLSRPSPLDLPASPSWIRREPLRRSPL